MGLTSVFEIASKSLAATSELVNDLEDLGYLTRRPDPADARTDIGPVIDLTYPAVQLGDAPIGAHRQIHNQVMSLHDPRVKREPAFRAQPVTEQVMMRGLTACAPTGPPARTRPSTPRPSRCR